MPCPCRALRPGSRSRRRRLCFALPQPGGAAAVKRAPPPAASQSPRALAPARARPPRPAPPLSGGGGQKWCAPLPSFANGFVEEGTGEGRGAGPERGRGGVLGALVPPLPWPRPRPPAVVRAAGRGGLWGSARAAGRVPRAPPSPSAPRAAGSGARRETGGARSLRAEAGPALRGEAAGREREWSGDGAGTERTPGNKGPAGAAASVYGFIAGCGFHVKALQSAMSDCSECVFTPENICPPRFCRS